jgi:hypothetical protein
MRHGKLTLSLLPDEYAVCKLDPEHDVPEEIKAERGWMR